DQALWFGRLAADHDNLRATLVWARAVPDGAARELRLAAALGRFWVLRGYGREGRTWLADALARGTEARSPSRARALAPPARLGTQYGNLTGGRALAEQGVAVAGAVGDPGLVAFALSQLAFACFEQGEVEVARALLGEAATTARRAGDARETAFALGQLGR